MNRLKNLISFDNLTSEFFDDNYINDLKKNLRFIINLFIDKTSYLIKIYRGNINTVPVLDFKIKGASNVIGDRSFSADQNSIKIGDIVSNITMKNGIRDSN